MRIQKTRDRLTDLHLEGFLVTSPENRRYLSGFTGSAGVVLICPDTVYLFVDFRYVEQAEQETEGFQVLMAAGKSPVAAALEKAREVGISKLAFEGRHVTVKEFEDMQDVAPGLELVSTENVCENLRMIKDETELDCIRKAAEIADHAFSRILNVIRPGISEREVALELDYHMQSLGSEGVAFSSIVASGARSALPHGRASDKTINSGDLVVLDFGAKYKGYCSDMTRTVAVGDVSSELKQVYDIVYEAQKMARENIKLGITGCEADKIARDIIESKGYGGRFGHGLGHGVGLLVHEEPILSPSRNTVLGNNMVITVEPGIYLPNVGGVRIEDLTIVKEEGLEIVSSSQRELIVIR